jgi:hypothetical protein
MISMHTSHFKDQIVDMFLQILLIFLPFASHAKSLLILLIFLTETQCYISQVF